MMICMCPFVAVRKHKDDSGKTHAAVVVLPRTAIGAVVEELGRVAGCKLHRCSKKIKAGGKRQKNNLVHREEIRCPFGRKVRTVKETERSRAPRPHTNRANGCQFRVRCASCSCGGFGGFSYNHLAVLVVVVVAVLFARVCCS
jgi:hypothetical protein